MGTDRHENHIRRKGRPAGWGLKTFIFLIAYTLFVSCNQPANGDDPVRRDSIGDPIEPADTAVHRLDPDSVTDDPKMEF